MLINQLDGVWVHPEGARGAFQFGGDWFQDLEGLKLCVDPAKLRGGGESERECYNYLEVLGVETGWASY